MATIWAIVALRENGRTTSNRSAVPLIVHDPRQPDALRNRIVDTLSLNLDLPSTFLDWAGNDSRELPRI